MTAASSNTGQLRYIKETVAGTTPTTGNGKELRTTQPTMKAGLTTVKSTEINKFRQVQSSTVTDLSVDGGLDFELSAKEYDPFIESVLFGEFAGLGEVTGTFTSTDTKLSLVGATLTPLKPGTWFKVYAPAAEPEAVRRYYAKTWFKVGSVSGTDVTLAAGQQVPAPYRITGKAGYKFSQKVVQGGTGTKAPSFTLEWEQADINQFLVYRGMMPNTLSLNFEVGAIVKGSVGFMGMTHDITQATTLPGSPEASFGEDVMNSVSDMGVIEAAGKNLLSNDDFIKSLKFDVNNNLRGQKAIGHFGNAGVGVGELAVSGTIEAYFQNADLYKKWLNSEVITVVFGVSDNNGNGYLVELPKVKFREGSVNGIQKDQDVMLSLPFDAFYDKAANTGVRIYKA